MYGKPHCVRYEIRHHGTPLGVVRAGGIDWISDARQDEAFFWFGWHAIKSELRMVRASCAKQPPAWYLNALKHSASLAAASTSTG
jgi:hypothetical protein